MKLPPLKPLPEFAHRAQAFSDLLPYAVKVAPDIVLNTDGSLTATYRYRGGDLESASKLTMADLSQRVNDAIKRFGPGWMFHFHSERKSAVGYPSGSTFPDATSWVIDEVRRANYEADGSHYVNDYWIDITYLPPTDSAKKGEQFLIEGQQELGAAHAAREALKTFNEHLRAFEGMLGPDLNLARVGLRMIEEDDGEVEVDEQISHFIKCATNRDVLVRALPVGAHVSPVVACMPLRNGFRLRIGDQLLSVLVITDMPGHSFPGMFDILNKMAYSYRASWRFIVRDPMAALRDIERERLKWFGKRRGMADALQGKESPFPDLDAVEMANDANIAAANCRSGEVVFGYFTMSLVFWERIEPNESEEEAWSRLVKTVDNVSAYIHRMHFQTYFETENVLEALLGTLPGIGHAQIRKPMLSSRNLADFIPTTAVWTGNITNPCSFYPPDSPPLAYVSTNGSTPFALNVHVGDVGHFLVAGETGAGKSVLLGFLLAQHRRYENARQVVFDVGRSHYALCMAVGGLHYEVGGDDGVAFCPLAHIGEPSERLWAEGWLAMLLLKQGVNPLEKRSQVFMALEALARSGPPFSLTNFVRQPFIDEEVREALRYYTIEGNSGGLLDAESDDLAQADFLVFEMQSLMDYDAKLREPVLTYLFHYMERLCTGRPTMLVLEEVWTFLDNVQASEAIKRWLKTLRKANVAVGFATQSLVDLINSPIRDALLGSCRTKMLLANPEANAPQSREAYTKIGLTPWQVRQLARAQRKRDYYVISDDGKRMISLDLSRVELAFVGVSDKDGVARVRRLVAEERSALIEHPETLTSRYPWQARWLAERVGGEKGQEWAKYWLDGWAGRGGYANSHPAAVRAALEQRSSMETQPA